MSRKLSKHGGEAGWHERVGLPLACLLTCYFYCPQPSISGVDLDKFREILLRHCDVNKDGKIQKSELALCLGLKINP